MSLQHLKHHLAEADVSVLLWHSTCCGHDVRALWWERCYKKGRLQTLPWHPFRVTRMVSIGEEGSTPGKSGSQHFCDCEIPSFWRPHQVLFPGCVPSVYQREGKNHSGTSWKPSHLTAVFYLFTVYMNLLESRVLYNPCGAGKGCLNLI